MIDDDKLTEHFKLSEFTKTSNKMYQEKNEAYGQQYRTRLENLAEFMEQVRKVCGCPILITSGIRCPELNKAVGGVATSHHVTGHACDFIPRGNGTVEDHFCKLYKSHIIYDQLILENLKGKVWLHISHFSMNDRRQALVYDGKKYFSYKG